MELLCHSHLSSIALNLTTSGKLPWCPFNHSHLIIVYKASLVARHHRCSWATFYVPGSLLSHVHARYHITSQQPCKASRSYFHITVDVTHAHRGEKKKNFSQITQQSVIDILLNVLRFSSYLLLFPSSFFLPSKLLSCHPLFHFISFSKIFWLIKSPIPYRLALIHKHLLTFNIIYVFVVDKLVSKHY